MRRCVRRDRPADCAVFRDALAEAADTGSPTIVIDFARTTFMGSTGIRELVQALRKVERIEARSPSDIVRRALEAAGLGDVIDFVD